jgi:anti-sigma-K factor RskA
MSAQQLTMSCGEVDELAGAYAVDALPPDELEAVEQHLATCRLSEHAEFHELLETAGMLPFSVTPSAPPPELASRILAAAGAGPTLASPNLRHDEPLRLKVVPFQRWRAFALAAAAALLVAIGLGWWGLSQHNALVAERQASQQRAALLALITSGDLVVQTPAVSNLTSGLLVQPNSGDSAYLVENWPAPPPGKTYQGWYFKGGAPVSAGVFEGGTNGARLIRLNAPLTGAQAFAVTVEPSGGSVQPTSQPLFVRPLTSG